MSKRMLGITLEDQSASEIIIIVEKKKRFQEMKNNPPMYTDAGVTTSYFKALLDNIAESDIMEAAWWNNTARRLNLPPNASLDLANREFYVEEPDEVKA